MKNSIHVSQQWENMCLLLCVSTEMDVAWE